MANINFPVLYIINEEKLKAYYSAYLQLNALKRGGVDNWEGYFDALDQGLDALMERDPDTENSVYEDYDAVAEVELDQMYETINLDFDPEELEAMANK